LEIDASCDLQNKIGQCTDEYVYGGIEEEESDVTENDYSPSLVFLWRVLQFSHSR
jgi:hypothetical protein